MVIVETIIAQEKELCKIEDPSVRQMSLIYSRAHTIATLAVDDHHIKSLLEAGLPKIQGLLGEMFHIHMKKCLNFFLESSEYRELAGRMGGQPSGEKRVIEYKKALLIPLRQSVGSCFATAFLIHLQKTDLDTLARDLFFTFSKNILTRVIEGKEVRIPFCAKTGKIEVSGIPIYSSLMKRYEFTVAGLADEKVGFSKWNFQVALGLDHTMEGGLGKIIHSILQEMLDKVNEELSEFKQDIESLYQGLDFDDAAFKAASTRERMDSIKRSAKAKQMQIASLEREMEISGKSGDRLAGLYKFFVEQYLTLFPHYFQELYDPEMFGEGEIEEDRPSGFRLVYKHGRSDSRVWTYVTNDKEYISCIRDFITITESILLNLQRGNGLEKEVEHIISEMLLAVDGREFLEDQRVRIQNMHKEYLKEGENLSPYAYIAGGNFDSLISTYTARVSPLIKESIRASKPMELFQSLVEFMKDENHFRIGSFEGDPFAGIMIRNDTHAFNFLPGLEPFKSAWKDRGNTYTYIRDNLLTKGEPIVFADTNWAAKFLAFLPDKTGKDVSLVLYDGERVYPFYNWDSFFVEGATWELFIK